MEKIDLVINKLKILHNPTNVAGMARFGINPRNTLGVSMVQLRKMGRELGKDHKLALKLWNSGIHEAKILAALVDDPESVNKRQMESWVKDFDSWDVCDQVCSNLFDKTPFAYQKALEWAKRKNEFEKRAGFVLMAVLAVHDKSDKFLKYYNNFFDLMLRQSDDERNFVKKAINWALRQAGKRSKQINSEAIKIAGKLVKSESASARWIGRDAYKELVVKRSKGAFHL